jgi:hypothetical protein
MLATELVFPAAALVKVGLRTGALRENYQAQTPLGQPHFCQDILNLLGPMRQHSRWTTGIDLLPNQLARSL